MKNFRKLRPDLGTVLSISLFVILFFSWEMSVRSGLVSPVVLPAPSDVFQRVILDVGQAGVRMDFYYTLTEVLAGFTLAAVVGISLGAVIALNPLVDKALTPLIVAIQTIPKVAIAPVLIIWFGFGIESKIVIVALIDFFPILVNAVTGFRSSDPRQIMLMKVVKASPWQIFLKVRLFNAIPYLMAGMYIAIVLSVIGAVIGEFLGSAHGLGSQLVQRQGSMDVVGVFSMLVFLSVMGVGLNVIMRIATKRLAFWDRQSDHSGL